MKMLKTYPIGEVRPSQLLLSYGVGALIDLPHISALIMGLDDWDITHSREITEDRLLSVVPIVAGVAVVLKPVVRGRLRRQDGRILLDRERHPVAQDRNEQDAGSEEHARRIEKPSEPPETL